MVHKRWKPEEERRLIEEFQKAGCSRDAVQQLAKEFNRSPDAIRKKLQRLGLNVVGAKLELTTTFEIPQALPSLEEVLLLLAGALKKAAEPGLGKTELQRLSAIAALYKAYESGLEKYVGYRQIETKLLELEKKYAELAQKA
ncbi:hypothetical protein KEJ45_06785 [Candidatus Bathyarchaeota archaeon]|nr:hypothetical protein [Candidatus Bathyarchaeota archaeon]